MSKIAIITDTHFGIKNDAQYMLAYQQKFYDEVFMPYIRDNEVKTVFHLGDLFDRRKYINFITLNKTKEMFLNPLRSAGAVLHIIPGNHDVYHKNTNTVNSLKELLHGYGNVNLIEDAKEQYHISQNFAFLPWINNENYADTLEFLKGVDKDTIVLGHLELSGFEMLAGVKNDHGMSSDIFKKFEQVWTGHFHHKSEKGNVKYLGAPMEFTFADCNDPRGFHVFDTDTKELEFIQNPFTMFEKIYYNDEAEEDQEFYRNVDTSIYAGKYIKLFAVNKTKSAIFEHFVDRLYSEDVINLIIHEDYSEFHESNIDVDIKEQSTKDLIDNYVDTLDTNMDKARIGSMLNTLYIEALHEQT